MGADPVHPTDQTLHAYGLGKLDDASSAAVSKHLESCRSCQRRVAEVSSDSFLGQLRGAQGAAEMSATAGPSQPGASFTDCGPDVAIAPPPADTMPPGLADHPDYEVIRELGRGGMGVVYLARNKLMGRLEVLKVVGGHLTERPGVRDRFLREVQSAAKLQHKNIVAAYSAVRLGAGIMLAMEYIDGEDLAEMVKSRGPLAVVHACYFIYQAALGLQHAHERGMVHRDIKPANLIFATEGKKGVVKVLDFGLAKVTSEGKPDGGLTREGQMLGTPDYIAPEQIRDAQSADIRADIYSLGCTLYYLLTGHPPFAGGNLWDKYQAHFSMDASPLNLVRPEVPAELAAVVAKMMAKARGDRFQTPAEVASALAPFFKPAAPRSLGSPAAVSRMNPPAPAQTSGAGPTPAEPATPLSTPAQPERKPSKTEADGVAWESLIDIAEDEPLEKTTKPKAAEPKPVLAGGPVRRPPWKWAAIAAASLFGLIALGVTVITIRDRHGVTTSTAPAENEFGIEKDEVTIENKPAPDRGASIGPRSGPATPWSDNHRQGEHPALTGAAVSPEGFVQLFNRRDVNGWQTHPTRPGSWRVQNGVLVGSGPVVGNLYSDGANYKDFHLRADVRFNSGANSGVLFPVSFGGNWKDEYEVQLGENGNGELHVRLNTPRIAESHVRPLEWFKLEVIVEGDHIVSKINGQTISDFFDVGRTPSGGHIALELCDTNTRVEFRRIEIKELLPGEPKAAAAQPSMPIGNPPAGEKTTPSDADRAKIAKAKAPSSEKSRDAQGKSAASGAGKVAQATERSAVPKPLGKASRNPRSVKTAAPGRVVGVRLEKIASKPSGPYPYAISPDSQRLVHPDWAALDVFELKTGTKLLSIDFRQIGARAVGGKGTEFAAGGVVCSDGNPVVIGADDVVRVLDTSTRKVSVEFQPRPLEEYINRGLWASGQDRIVGRGGLDIHFWDSRTGNRINKWNARDVIAMDVSPLGNHDVVTIHNNHVIRVWNVATEQQKREIPDASKRRNNIRFSRDGVRLLTWASGDKDFYLFDPDKGVEITYPGDFGNVRQVAAFPDAPLLASGDSDGNVQLWDVNEVRPIVQEKCLAPVNQVLISPDGNYLVITMDREIIFYRVHKIRAEPKPKRRR